MRPRPAPGVVGWAAGWVVASLLLTSGCVTAHSGQWGMQRQGLEAPREGGFEVDLSVDVVTTVGMFAVALLVDRNKAEWAGVPACAGEARPPTEDEAAEFDRLLPHEGVCDDAGVPRLDRPVTGLSSRGARRLSDIGLLGMALLPYAVSAADTGFNRLQSYNFGIDAVVISQALAATMLTTAVAKVIARRARPLTYNPAFDKQTRFDGDARLSFPSGHSAMSFAAASVTTMMLLERYPDRPAAAIGAVGAYLGAGSVATLRVLAGKHFVTDVVAGAAVGTALGLALSLAHVRDEPVPVGETTSAQVRQDRAVVPIFGWGGTF